MDRDISVCQDTVFESLYKSFTVKVIGENKKVEKQLGRPLSNFDKLYGRSDIGLSDDRILNIRWIKIPTFTHGDTISYYTIFFSEIEFWRVGEMIEISHHCRDAIEKRDTDSYNIFLAGKMRGFLDPKENRATRNHIFIFNEYPDEIDEEHKKRILKTINKFLDFRCIQMSKGAKVFGRLEKDVKRITEFVSYLNEIERALSIKPMDLGVVQKI